MSNGSIRPIDRITTSGQSGPRSDGNEGALSIPQSPGIAGVSP